MVSLSFLAGLSDFNPHHHAGGDRTSSSGVGPIIDFNPHHHAGGDLMEAWKRPGPGNFNPHHHAGGDGWSAYPPAILPYFNPHHHAGGDGHDLDTGGARHISIHTTTQVVTAYDWDNNMSTYISIHTTTQVVTDTSGPASEGMRYFNPHHHAGGDSKSTQLFILISVNFHINLLLQPLTTSKPSKSIPKTPTIPDSPGANLPGVSWVLPIRTGVSEN